MAGTSSAEECKLRVQRLQKALTAGGLQGAFLVSPHNVRYFTGFTGADSYLLVAGRKRWLLTDPRYTEEAALSASGVEVVCWKKHPAEFAAELLRKAGIGKIGFCQHQLTVAWFQHLKKAKLTLQPVDEAIAKLRAIKSADEVKAILKALKCAQEAFRALKPKLKAGMTEMEVRLELEYQMLTRGASAPAFETIIAAGANASLPHAHAGSRKLRPGGVLLMDFGACVEGYNSDLTRTVFIDTIPKIWLRRYEAVLAAQAAGIAALKAGVAAAKADEAAKAVFAEAGLLEKFTHSLGHGVGIEVHEAPRLSSRTLEMLQTGNIVTVEPGIYLPGQGGIRIEDMALITPQGVKVLSSLEKDAASAVV